MALHRADRRSTPPATSPIPRCPSCSSSSAMVRRYSDGRADRAVASSDAQTAAGFFSSYYISLLQVRGASLGATDPAGHVLRALGHGSPRVVQVAGHAPPAPHLPRRRRSRHPARRSLRQEVQRRSAAPGLWSCVWRDRVASAHSCAQTSSSRPSRPLPTVSSSCTPTLSGSRSLCGPFDAANDSADPAATS